MTARRLATALAAASVALLAPADALAHAGPTPPVATSFVAEITSLPARLEARVIDGDQQLTLRVPPSLTVVVLGLAGEPYLRFNAAGVAVNDASPTAYLNRPQAAPLPAGMNPRRPPRWQHLSNAHSFRWHEDRLHALALTAHNPHTPLIGSWSIPLRIDGQAGQIRGELWYRPPPSRLWFWPIPVVLACAIALLRLRQPAINTALAAAFTAAGLIAIILAHLARDLYGRPAVTAGQLTWLAASSAFALAAAVGLARPRWRPLAHLATSGYALTVALTLLPTLRKGHTLAAVPPTIDRLTATLALTAACGGLITLATGTLRPRPRYTAARRERATVHPQQRSQLA